MTTLEFILSLVSALLSGGLITLATLKFKRKQEEIVTNKQQLDLIDQMFKQHNSSMLEQMKQNDELLKKYEEERLKNAKEGTEELVKEMQALKDEMAKISEDVNNIKGFLNGNFRKYVEQHRNSKGQFCKAKETPDGE